MLNLLIGYLFLLIFRPYEYWPALGDLHIERFYFIILIFAALGNIKNKPIKNNVSAALMIFYSAMILSGVASLKWEFAYEIIYDYARLVVLYFVIIISVKDVKDLRKIIYSFYIIMLLYAGKSAWEYFVNGRHVFRMGMSRMIGIDITYGDPNAFAATVAYSLCYIALIPRMRPLGKWVNRFAIFYIFLSIVCVMFTGSRSGMLTVLLLMVMYWLTSSKKVLSLLTVSIILIISWNLMPDVFQLRFESIFQKGVGPAAASADNSAEGRLVGFLHGVDVFMQYPLLGAGPGNFKITWDEGMNAHNLYGQILGEIGGIGTFAYSALVYCVMNNLLIVMRRYKKKYLANSTDASFDVGLNNFNIVHAVAIGSMYMIILLLFNGIFGHNLYRYHWLFVAAISTLCLKFSAVECNVGVVSRW